MLGWYRVIRHCDFLEGFSITDTFKAIFQAQKCNKNSTANLKSATTTQQLKSIDIQTLSPSCKQEAQRFAQEIKFAQRPISLSLLLLWQAVFILEKQLSCQEPNKYSSKKTPTICFKKVG